MITFEIIHSPDPFVIGNQTFNKNILTFATRGSDINIQDKQLNKEDSITLEVEGKNLFVYLSNHLEKILVNKKRVTQNKRLNIGDEVQFLNTIIKIISYEVTVYESQKKTIIKNLKQIDDDKSLKDFKGIINKTKEYLGIFNDI